jgi:transposase, IS30 family
MVTKHKKLSVKEREEIFRLVCNGESIRGIARLLGRSHSSISAELKRNGMSRSTYSLSEAQVDCNLKRTLKGPRPKLQENQKLLYLTETWILKKKWSPEQVSDYLKKNFKNDKAQQVSHETIYQYIYSISDPEEKEKYIKALRRKRKKENLEMGLKNDRDLFLIQLRYTKDRKK